MENFNKFYTEYTNINVINEVATNRPDILKKIDLNFSSLKRNIKDKKDSNVTRYSIPGGRRVFHQGPSLKLNMTGCSFTVLHLLDQRQQRNMDQIRKKTMN